VQVDVASAVLQIAPNPTNVVAGGIATLRVTRNGGTIEDLLVTLESSNPTKATVPEEVTILAGESVASFDVTGLEATASPITISANAVGYSNGTAAVSVLDPTLVTTPTNIHLHAGATHQITLSRASGDSADYAAELVVTLSSSDAEARPVLTFVNCSVRWSTDFFISPSEF
jgi:uncharacterized protein YjdB